MNPILGIFIFVVWLYVLYVCHRSELWAWKYVIGSFGVFIIMMIWIRPVCTEPLAQIVAAVAGFFGQLTGLFSSYFRYSVIFIESKSGAISLLIDFECSGILEIMAYLSLLIFFRAYSIYERVIVGIIGTAYIIVANAIRIISICFIIHFFGMQSYYVAHTFVGRLIFYFLSVLLYFFVFTKTQIVRQRVGGFSYGANNK